MKAIKSQAENNRQIPINYNQIKATDYSTSFKELLLHNNTINNKNVIKSKAKRIPTLYVSNQEKLKRTIIKKFGITEKNDIKVFDYSNFVNKEYCTSYFFGDEPIEQKAFICTICDNKKKNYMCYSCHKNCHQKCRETLKEIPKSLAKNENPKPQKFACYCGCTLKHIISTKNEKELVSCTMMELDRMLGILPYYCKQHNVIVCCICHVVCHDKENGCTVVQLKDANLNTALSCQCKSDHHSNFNELALSFPLEEYKKKSNIDVWPVQILNILFYKGKTFEKMSEFFNVSLTTEINFSSDNNFAIINKFQNLLELFSNTFNRKFKTYYYAQQMISTFDYQKLFSLIEHLEVCNGQTTIIKFRLLFILLFIHLRKDFRTIKSLTSNDFMCNTVLQRLTYKKLLRSKTILTEKIDEKYRITQDFPIKKFVLDELCDLISKGMELISVEENQDEFEIGLKIICFMIKRLMFNKEELIILINSLANFHTKFYDYIIKKNNNIYSLIDIFNVIVEICYMISVNYNDLVIEDYLNDTKKDIGKFIHAKSEHGNKLLSIILKNCDLITKHYKILIKPSLDKKSEEEKKREKKVRKHFLVMQDIISSKTTGVKIKMPENGGLFTDKIIFLHNETLSMFSLADNSYQKHLDYINDEELADYYSFCKIIEDKTYQEIMNDNGGLNEFSNNILYNLKLGLEDGYYSLFTSSYKKEENLLNENLKSKILMACDSIKKNIDIKCEEPYYSNLIAEMPQKQNQYDDVEILKRKILNDISGNINFANSPFLLIEEGRDLIVNNLILTQVDESIFKGFFFLTNIHFPNIINYDLIKIFFDFLYLYLLTKRGIMYILTGKNIQVIQRLINRFRFDDKMKNINVQKHRTEDFNVKSIKIVIHFLCILSKFIKILNIKTLSNHKALFKFRKSILSHLRNFVYHIRTENLIIEYKIQLKEGLEIFNNLFDEFNFNQYEKIKRDIIDIFKNNTFHFLDSKLFLKWFDKSKKDRISDFMERRRHDLDYYFQFFEIVTKNSYYVYQNDEEGKQNIETLINFINLKELSSLLINAPEIISINQKSILLKFIRTFYLIDYLDQINYLKKYHLLGTKQYKILLKYHITKDKALSFMPNTEFNNINNNKIDMNNNINNSDINNINPQINGVFNNNNLINNNNNNYNNFGIANNNIGNINQFNNNNSQNAQNINKEKYQNKLQYIDKLIILINFYINEIESFPHSIKEENNQHITKYMEELIFAVHEISITIYYTKDAFNKILPYYYKLIVEFIKKKEIFIKIFEDIEENKHLINPKDYNNLLYNINESKDYKFIINKDFNIFDKFELFKYAIKSLFEVYKKTTINEEYSLKRYLELYDVYNEANFPPFSLLEVYDYEYFYDGQNVSKPEETKDNNENLEINLLDTIRESYLEQFRNISETTFLSVLSGDGSDKKVDFGEKYVNLFQSYINSTQSNSFTTYRTLLCIMTKMLFYDGEHIQSLFSKMASDKYFFNNLNRELNNYIVQCIDLSTKYEMCSRCAEITDITKLTIQFLQLLGEGFNIEFHGNILKGEVKPEKKKIKAETATVTNYFFESEDESSNNSDEEADENGVDLAEPALDPPQDNSPLKSDDNLNLQRKVSSLEKEIPLIEPKCTIYETAILNLKRIYHLMELNNLLEGESGFDKLCVLSSNIIDFIIEYIDTIDDLTYIIDNNLKSLFFGKVKEDKIATSYSYMDKKGILPVFTMKIKENYEEDYEESFNKYKLRKTMLAYIKIKYFQLLKAYLQIGNKNDFVQLMISEHLGPIQLFGEILYYMKELINNLVFKDYEKYKDLLNIDNVNSYKEKLNKLYMFEDDFRTSVEISVVFQICIIIATLEDTYKVTMLRDNYTTEQAEEKTEPIIFNEIEDKSNMKKSFTIEEMVNSSNGPKDLINLNENKCDYSIIDDIDDKEILNLNKKRIKNEDGYLQINRNNSNDINVKESSIKFIISNTNNNDFKHLNYPSEESINNISYNKMKKIKKNKPTKSLNFEKRFLKDDNLNLSSKFSKAIYKFLDSLVSKVEIKIEDEKDVNEDEEDEVKDEDKENSVYKSLTNEISKKIISHKNDDIILSNINYDDIYGYNLDNNYDYEFNNKANNDNNKDDEKENMDTGKKLVFFIKPYLSFHLSEQTKVFFLYNVDRDTATSKYRELVSYTDYFMFEMMYNMKYINNSKLLNSLSKISYYVLQCFNFLLVLAENALLMYHYYRDYSLDYNEYDIVDDSIRYKRFTDIVIIIVIKLILIFFALFVWFYCNFIITYQRNVIVQEDKNFIFRQLGEPNQHIIHPTMVRYFREEGNLLDIMSIINGDISFFKMIKLAAIDSVLLNIDVNVFVFSFILDVLFLIFGHPLILSIETLLIYGIFPSLVNIFKSFIDKSSTFLSCLLFTYLLIYVYNYISIFYIRKSFDVGEVLEYEPERFINEPYCHSSIQCFLTLISYGTRAGGGIGDALPIVSFKKDINMFIGRFFYDMTFYIFIIMIMGNVTFGLIVDTFGGLRDDTYKYEKDRTNKCFICQISRDMCLLKNIVFDTHIKQNHNLWSYVDFLCYLHLYNANDFTRVEGSVWDKLLNKDYDWLPIVQDEGEDEDEDD